MLSNWEQVEKATKAAYESEGTAAKENEIYMNSLQGKLDSLKAVWQTFSADFLNSSFLKSGVQGATELLNVLDKIQNTIGTLGMVGATGGLIAFIKNLDKLKTFGEVFDATKVIKNNLNDFSAMKAGLDAFSASTVAAAASSAGLDAANTAAIFSSAGLSSTMSASAMATAGYDASLTAATLSQMGFADAEIASAMASAGYTAEATSAAIANVSLGTTATGAATGFGALTASIMGAVRGLALFLATTPVGWAITAGAAIFATAKIVDHFTTTIDEAVDNAEDAREKYKSAQSDLQNVESQREQLKQQLSDLAGKYNIEVTDNDTIGTLRQKISELKDMSDSDTATFENLERQNDLLYSQMEIKKRIKEYEQKNSAKSAKTALTDTKDGVWLDQFDEKGNQIYREENLIQRTNRKQQELNKTEKEYNQLLKEHRNTQKEESTFWKKSQWDKEEEKLADLEKKRTDLSKELAENLNTISENYDSLFDEDGNPLEGFEDTARSVGYFLHNMMGIKEATDEVTESAEQMEQTYRSSISDASKSATEFKTNLDAITEAVNAQTTGKSVSLDTYNSEALKDYSSALEYHNGVMQYNLDKVKEITKAKYEEEKANIANGKAMDQAKYLENAREIQKLRGDLSTATGWEKNMIEESINSLLEQNSTLVESCKQWDILSASLDQATSRYQNWINAQSASQSGEMFDSSLTAFKKINDTLNKSDSDDYGRVGNADYKAAVEFIVPDKVSKQGEEAINNYMTNLKRYLTFDDNGEADGMNIQQFCQDALDKGLMQISKDGQSYEIAGKQTMQQFADGMGLALPVVQAMFGEMEEFGAEFDWSDEAVKTFGDLAMQANESAEALRKVKGFENMNLVLDVSGFEDKEKAIDTLNSEIDQLTSKRAKLSVDSDEYRQAGDVIQYLVAERQILEQPTIMTVDTSQVAGEVGEAIALLQEYQKQKNEIEILNKVGADTSEADAKLEELKGRISNSKAMASIGLKIDESQDIGAQIDSKIAGLDKDAILKLDVDTTAFDDYTPSEKESTVKFDKDSSIPDNYQPSDKYAKVKYTLYDGGTKSFMASVVDISKTITYTYKTVGSPPKGSGTVNGTAHASGTAFANGNWGTAPGGETLVGELGKTLPKRIYIG